MLLGCDVGPEVYSTMAASAGVGCLASATASSAFSACLLSESSRRFFFFQEVFECFGREDTGGAAIVQGRADLLNEALGWQGIGQRDRNGDEVRVPAGEKGSGVLFHRLTKTQWAHVHPDFLDVIQAFLFRAALARTAPALGDFLKVRPDRVLLFVVHNDKVRAFVFDFVHVIPQSKVLVVTITIARNVPKDSAFCDCVQIEDMKTELYLPAFFEVVVVLCGLSCKAFRAPPVQIPSKPIFGGKGP